MVVLEAMAAGLPAITSQFSGAAELITPGQDGFVLQNPADAGEIAGMLETLFDPSLRAAVGAAALQTARAFMQNPKNEIGAVVEELAAAVFRGRHDRASGRLTGHDTG
jgi:glycosyltransferase involved in cell wall biosynthesis